MQRKREIHILTFHGLGRPERALVEGEDAFWLDPSFFESILAAVKHRPDVQITFDDSNSSDFRIAFPVLMNMELRATFFVVSHRIDTPGFLTTHQIQELARAGMSIGSHGTQHRPWAELNVAELQDELNGSRKTLEAVVGQAVREAACPFGSYNRRVLRSLRAAGYTKVYTSDDGSARSGDWLLARNTITKDHTVSYIESLLESPPRPWSAFWRRLKSPLKRLR